MANYFSNLLSGVGSWMAQRIAGYLNDAMAADYSVLGSYYQGAHRPPLKVRPGAQDDNIIQNFIGLAVDRSVSRLFKGGITFNLPEGADEQSAWLKSVWDLNKKEILLYQVGLHGTVYGTYYFKISPDGLVDPYTGQVYPRLIALDPEITRIKTDPQDMNRVLEYRIEFTYAEQTGENTYRPVSVREITRPSDPARQIMNAEGAAAYEEGGTWVVEMWKQYGSGVWTLETQTVWPYDFPPIIHGKNLPSLKSCYGDSDIDDAINAQDRSNFVASNTSKIIKYHASPTTIGIGFGTGEMKPADNAPDKFWTINNEKAQVFNLEMATDLASSTRFGESLRQSIFDLSREVDISSMADKVGALTNFGLAILWSDAIDKNDTKRQLYGDTLLELNRRLLVLRGYVAEASNPGGIQWGNALPSNIVEDLQADQTALAMGIVDKATVAARYQFRYGKSWDEIQQALADQSTADNQNNADIGSMILRNFTQGKGVVPQQQRSQQPAPVNQ